MRYIRLLVIFCGLVTGLTSYAGIRPATVTDLNSTCWNSGRFGHYPNYEAWTILFNENKTGRIEAGQMDKGSIFGGPLSWTMQNDILSYVFATQTKSYSVKISEDGEYLYLEGSAPYLFQRTSYPQNSNCLYPW